MLHSLFRGSAIITRWKKDKTWFYELFIHKRYPGTLRNKASGDEHPFTVDNLSLHKFSLTCNSPRPLNSDLQQIFWPVRSYNCTRAHTFSLRQQRRKSISGQLTCTIRTTKVWFAKYWMCKLNRTSFRRDRGQQSREPAWEACSPMKRSTSTYTA